MKTSFLVNAVLTIFVLSNLVSALTFMAKQRLGASCIESIDRALIRGAWFFALGSGLTFITVMYGGIPDVFI